MNKNIKKDNGAVTLIEATIVFPIVFIVLFFIICLGNAYYTRSYMDSIAAQCAVIVANYASNETVWETEKPENQTSEAFTAFNLNGHDINPYQYTVSQALLDDMNMAFEKAASGNKNTILASMAPSNIEPYEHEDFIYPEWGFVNSTITVSVKYTINVIPFVKNLGVASHEYHSKGVAVVNDNVEFIRNMDLIEDLFIDFTQTEIGKKITDNIATTIDSVVDKVKGFFTFFNGGK